MSIKNLHGSCFDKRTEFAFKFMYESGEVFWLTGSRFFNTNDQSSDWDFFVTFNDVLKDKLIDLGFKDVTSDYMDRFGHSLDNHLFKIFRKGRVDIQLVKSANLKNKVQVELLKSGLMYQFKNDKPMQTKLWCTMFNLVDCMTFPL